MKRSYRDLIAKKKVKNRTNNKQKPIDLNTINVPLSNKFDLLSDMEEESAPVYVQKIAPIIITDFNSNIQSIISELQINCDIKIMSIGRKIVLQSASDKKKLIDALKTTKTNFFSHPDATSKIFKAVLSGLPEIPTADIVSCLERNNNPIPMKIVMFTTNSYNKLYLCHFDQTHINMKVLKAIKVVHQHIVTWMPYKPKRLGPTQCFKCCMYGHGISSCNRFSVCMLCSGNHTTKECNTITPSTINPIYKCFNCASANIKHDHKANDPNCPFRAKYELSRDNARNKHKPKSPTARQMINSAYNKSDSAHRFVMAPKPPPLHTSYASIARTHSNSQTNSNPHSMNTNTAISNDNNNLWTISEVTELLLNSINELNKCTTKFDQLKIIANLLQHACK